MPRSNTGRPSTGGWKGARRRGCAHRGGGGGGACRAGTNQAQRATRLWADGDAPRELALPAEGAERSGVARPAAGAGRGAPAIWLSAAVHFPAAGGGRGGGPFVGGGTPEG